MNQDVLIIPGDLAVEFGALAEDFCGKNAEAPQKNDLLSENGAVAVLGATDFRPLEWLEIAGVKGISESSSALLKNIVENSYHELISLRRINRHCSDIDLLAKLGKRGETQLSHFFALLKEQSCGQPGPLSLDLAGNLAYKRLQSGNILAVIASWAYFDRYWCLNAELVSRQRVRCPGCQVISLLL